jgi:ATP-dependent Clp protease ATP-binding subunit ClpC
MFENLKHFDHSARRALALAQEEAQALGHEQLDSDHVLLALVRNPASATCLVLERMAITPERLREEILHHWPARPHPTRGELPVTPRFKRLLQAALRESVRSRERTVTTTHLLVALAEDGTSVAGRALAALGADPQSLRDQVAAVEDEATLRAQLRVIQSPTKDPGASSPSPPARRGELELSPRPRHRARRLLPRLVNTALLLQMLVFSLLALAGWGSLPNRDIDPPRMERIGAPPGLIDTYADLSHITFPLEYAASREIATAAFVGTPADWGGPEPTPPSLNVFGQSPSTTLHQLAAGSANTIMFIVPSSTVQHGPLYVVIKGDRYRLSLVTDESYLGFAVVTAAVNNHLLSAFASSLLWLTLPAPTSTLVPLILIRRDPGAQEYALTHGTLGVTSQTGVIATPVGGVTLGTPVVAITSSTSALAGFLETAGPSPSSFVSTSVVAKVLNTVGPSISGGN